MGSYGSFSGEDGHQLPRVTHACHAVLWWFKGTIIPFGTSPIVLCCNQCPRLTSCKHSQVPLAKENFIIKTFRSEPGTPWRPGMTLPAHPELRSPDSATATLFCVTSSREQIQRWQHMHKFSWDDRSFVLAWPYLKNLFSLPRDIWIISSDWSATLIKQSWSWNSCPDLGGNGWQLTTKPIPPPSIWRRCSSHSWALEHVPNVHKPSIPQTVRHYQCFLRYQNYFYLEKNF